MRRRILVTPRSLTRAGLDAVPELGPLRDAGYELIASPPGATPSVEDLTHLLPGCVGWLAGVEPITADVLAHADALRVISRNGTGTDAIDLEAAAAAGVAVERAPAANAQGVAELAITLTLAALRGVPSSARALAEGRWERPLGRELADCPVGVVGLGAVGRRVAGLFTALGAPVTGFDPFVTGGDVPLVTLPDLVRDSAVVTLHSSPPEDGRPLLDRDLLALAGPDTVLVNTARSALVDDDAVLEALEDGRLSAYAVDAFDTEPPAPSPLLRHPRVIATPHLGGYTTGSISRATAAAVANLLAALPEGTTR